MAQAVAPFYFAKPALAGLLALAGLAAQAQPTVYEGPLPTRMQFCQAELQGVEGEERRRQLRECLLRRADAERLVVRDCRQRVREARVAPADRFRFQRDCEYRAFAVHSSELPQPPLAAAPEPVAAVGMAVSDSAPALPVAPQALEPTGPVTTVEVPAAP